MSILSYKCRPSTKFNLNLYYSAAGPWLCLYTIDVFMNDNHYSYIKKDVFIDAGLIVLFIIGGIGTIISAGQVWNIYAEIPRTLSATCVS